MKEPTRAANIESARRDLKDGGKPPAVERTERGMKSAPHDPKHVKAMEIARRAFRAYANTFKALAK
jgi:hypothetical protein